MGNLQGYRGIGQGYLVGHGTSESSGRLGDVSCREGTAGSEQTGDLLSVFTRNCMIQTTLCG